MTNYSITWCNESWISFLNEDTALDYFCQPSNPFYDNTCNNETIRMQRLDIGMLNELTGVEYILAHYFNPSLFIIRKQYRLSPDKTKSLCLFYVVQGVVYQCPDTGTWLNSRISAISSGLLCALDIASKHINYNVGSGFQWNTPNNSLSINTSINDKRANMVAILDNSIDSFIHKLTEKDTNI